MTALAEATQPIRLLTAPRGLQNEEPGLYPDEHLTRLLAEHPQIAHERWNGFNHYTVVLSAAGAERLARVVADELALAAA